jgi:hypothetical protein
VHLINRKQGANFSLSTLERVSTPMYENKNCEISQFLLTSP